MSHYSAASSLTRRVTIVCGLRPLQIIGNPNRGAGLLARKGEHLRAVHNNVTYALRKCAVRRVQCGTKGV